MFLNSGWGVIMKTDRAICLLLLLIGILMTSCTAHQNNTETVIPTVGGFSRTSCSTEVMTEHGFIFIPDEFSGLNLLYYFDTSSGMCVPLCAKPNCSHDDNSCNAYFGSSSSTHPSGYTLQLLNGYLYLWVNEPGRSSLWRCLPDGSNHEKVCTLQVTDAPSGGQVISSFIRENDCYVQVSYPQDARGSDVDGLFRVSLPDGEARLITMSNDDTDWVEHRMYDVRYEEGTLYYRLTEFRPQEARSRVFAYDPETESSTLLYSSDRPLSFVVMNDNLLIYEYQYGSEQQNIDEHMILYSPADHTKETLSIPAGYLTYDGTYLYINPVSDPPSSIILDNSLNEVTVVTSTLRSDSSGFTASYTNEEYVVFEKLWNKKYADEATASITYQFFPKSEIGKDSLHVYEISFD